MDRRYTSEEELCAGGIRARNVRVVQSAGLGRVQRRQRGIRGNIQSSRPSKRHECPLLSPGLGTVLPHSSSHAAVLGTLAEIHGSSAARRLRSATRSMS
jgi:hypothetical protein